MTEAGCGAGESTPRTRLIYLLLENAAAATQPHLEVRPDPVGIYSVRKVTIL